MEIHEITRRGFIATAAGSIAALSSIRPTAAETLKADRPKIGAVSWCFHSFSPGADPTDAIEILGELGFEGTDLILLGREDITGFWTDAKIDDLKRRLEKHKMAVAQFVLFQPVVEGLTSTNAEERKRNLDYFESGVKVGKRFNAPMVNIVAPWPREWNRPGGGYLPRYYDLPDAPPGEKFHIDIAPGFDWDKLWADWITTVKACLERCKAHGMRLSIEHHTHTMIPDATSFLRLWDAIKDPDLGYNLDTGWTLSQREYPPVAIHKTRRQLFNIHVRDIDNRLSGFPHVGTGVMDFKHVAETLKQIGYQGFLSIEQDKYPGDMKETCRRYLALMKEYLS